MVRDAEVTSHNVLRRVLDLPVAKTSLRFVKGKRGKYLSKMAYRYFLSDVHEMRMFVVNLSTCQLGSHPTVHRLKRLLESKRFELKAVP